MDLMQITRNLAQHGAKRKLVRAIPFLGSVFSALYVAQRIRTKGVRRGAVDAALDLTPIVGQLKAVYELFRGDIIAPPDTRHALPAR